MIWEVEWSAAAEEPLLGLRRWRDAERKFRLFVEPFVLRCSFEPSVPSVRVWALYEKR